MSKNEMVDIMAFALYLEDWDCVRGTENIEYYWKRWINEGPENKVAEHCGDCTNQPISCIRCEWDERYKEAARIVDGMTTTP